MALTKVLIAVFFGIVCSSLDTALIDEEMKPKEGGVTKRFLPFFPFMPPFFGPPGFGFPPFGMNPMMPGFGMPPGPFFPPMPPGPMGPPMMPQPGFPMMHHQPCFNQPPPPLPPPLPANSGPRPVPRRTPQENNHLRSQGANAHKPATKVTCTCVR